MSGSPIQPLLQSIQKKGIVLPNKYTVQCRWPRLMNGVGAGIMRDLTEDLLFRVSEVNLAGRTITSFPEPNIYGPIREVPEGVSYAEEITIQFLETKTMECREIFAAWQETIFDNTGSWNLQYYNDYIGELDIVVLGQHSYGWYPSYGIRCFEVYPKTLGPIQLSSARTTDPIKTQVSFAFRYWKTFDMYEDQDDSM